MLVVQLAVYEMLSTTTGLMQQLPGLCSSTASGGAKAAQRLVGCGPARGVGADALLDQLQHGLQGVEGGTHGGSEWNVLESDHKP